jgi:hypothetical protein
MECVYYSHDDADALRGRSGIQMLHFRLVAVLLFGVLGSAAAFGCALTSKARDFHSLPNFDGSQAVHINTTKIAIHALIFWPFIGDATLDGAVREFTKEAKKEGARKVRIVQSNETTLWWIFPPISFFLTPRLTNVAGDALKEPGSGPPVVTTP